MASPASLRGLYDKLLPLIKKKTFIVGVSLILFWGLLGALAPILATVPYEERQRPVADAFAVPEWAAPPTLPPNINKSFAGWFVVNKSFTGEAAYRTVRVPGGVVVEMWGRGTGYITLVSEDFLDYPYDPPERVVVESAFTATPLYNGTPIAWYNIQIILLNENVDPATEYVELSLGGNASARIPRGAFYVYDAAGLKVGWPYPLLNEVREAPVPIVHSIPNPMLWRIQPFIDYRRLAGKVEALEPFKYLLYIPQKTKLRVAINITYFCEFDLLLGPCTNASLRLFLRDVIVRIPGRRWGILGTNYQGADNWSNLLYGARSAVVLGLSVATAIVMLGLLVGLSAGYRLGSFYDMVVTFITDVVYFIPALPLILSLGIVFGRQLWVIYMVFILLAWPGTARTVRHWTASLKANLFIEAARAAGASDTYIMLRHIAPQLTPYLVYSVVMGVPGAIFFEAAIQLLGFGDPEAPTWGKMINDAYYQGAFLRLAWWDIFPPIIGLITLALGFVLVGMALDEYVNPRLRR